MVNRPKKGIYLFSSIFLFFQVHLYDSFAFRIALFNIILYNIIMQWWQNTYKLKIIEKFEDWYVADCSEEVSHSTIEDAVNALVDECNNIMQDPHASLALDKYIEEELKPIDFKSEYGNCSIGFSLTIEDINEEQIIHITIDYDYIDKSKKINLYEVIYEEISPKLLNKINGIININNE